MSRAMDGWPTPHTPTELLQQMSRQTDLLDRRNRIPNAAQIMGPGLGPRAAQLADWNSEETTFNGIFWSEVGSVNSPNAAKRWMGFVRATSTAEGVMELTEFGDGVVIPQVYRRLVTVTGAGTRVFGAWALVSPLPDPHAADGIWVDHTSALNMPNVNKSVAYARYMLVGNTITYQGAVVIIAGGVSGQAFIELPAGMDWGPGWPYIFSIGWQQMGPVIGKLRALRSGVSWYEGDIIPYAPKVGAQPGRAAIWNPGTTSASDGSSSGGTWTGTSPAAWSAAGIDYWSFSFTTEIVR